jgi:glycosyltransferase involved in cell wall biosynthesis
MSKFLITVGIPFYNAKGTLLEAIRSIFAQTFTDWELILVDDGSTDGSVDIARSIDDPRVRLLVPDGRNLRLAARLNQIAQAAKGEYIARMDADDLCHPERFTRQLEFLQTHPEVDVVGTSMCILDEQCQPSQKLIVAETNEAIFKNKYKGGVSIIHPTIMARAEWFRKWPYDGRDIRCEDYGLWMRSCKSTIYANIQTILYFKDEHLTFSIRKYAKSKNTAAMIIWKHALKELGALSATCYAGKRYLDIGIYAVSIVLGFHNKLINRRYQALDRIEHKEASMAIDIITNTKVPARKVN